MALNEKLRFLSKDKRDNVEINSNKSQIYLLQQTWFNDFFFFALVPWIFQSFNQLGQNPELQAWKHEAHKENIKKKKKKKTNQKKQTNKNIHPLHLRCAKMV